MSETGRSGAAPLFSVVIATYNRRDLIPHTLESVFRQTERDFEVIVVDDGSTDDTRSALEPWIDRIRYVYQQNRGVAAAWNRGIGLARGRIVGFLASDDLWEPRTLEKVRAAFEKHPEAGLVSVMAREIDAEGRPTGRIQGKKTPGAWYSTVSLLCGDSGGCSWFFARRELLAEAGGYDESIRSAEECDLLLRLSLRTKMFALREPLLLRRTHGGNLSGDRLLNAREWLRILEKFRREHPEFLRRHPRVFRRALGKERLRCGRELLVRASGDRGAIAEARRMLLASIRAYPFVPRAYSYLLFAWLAPRAYARWRRWELSHRARPRQGRPAP